MTDNRLIAVTKAIGGVLADEGRRLTRRDTQSGEHAAQARARSIRTALERLGPLYVKVGQILSTRPDLVSPVMMREFERLHDRVAVVPFDTFDSVLSRDLGSRWRRYFGEVYTDQPLGSASLAQVYRVTLRGGQPAVLKVQRPDIRPIVLADMKLLRRTARVCGQMFRRFNEVIDLEAMVDVVFVAMTAELDFQKEAANMHQAREAIDGFDNLTIPEVFHASRHVLVQSLAPGRSIRDVDRASLPDSERLAIGRDLLAFMYHSYFVERMFHADPHPGNIFVQRDEPAALIDWGMVGRVDRSISMTLVQILLHVAANDGPSMARAWVELGRATSRADLTGFCNDMAAFVPTVTNASLEELNFGVNLMAVLKHSSKRGIQTNPIISLLGKSLANAEGSVRYLAPELQLTEVFAEELRHILIQYAIEAFSQQEIARTTLELLAAGSSSIEHMRGLLRDFAQRDFTLRVPSSVGASASLLKSKPLLALAAIAAVALLLRGRKWVKR